MTAARRKFDQPDFLRGDEELADVGAGNTEPFTHVGVGHRGMETVRLCQSGLPSRRRISSSRPEIS